MTRRRRSHEGHAAVLVVRRGAGDTVTVQPEGHPEMILKLVVVKRDHVGIVIDQSPPWWQRKREEKMLTLNDGSLLKVVVLSIDGPRCVRFGFGAPRSVRLDWSQAQNAARTQSVGETLPHQGEHPSD
jgi:hypothetical protein